MKIIAIEKEYEGKTWEDFKPYLEEEAKAVWKLYQRNIIREIYFRADQSSAVLILECTDLIEAKKNLSELPLVKENLIFFELILLAPYHGLERLLKK